MPSRYRSTTARRRIVLLAGLGLAAALLQGCEDVTVSALDVAEIEVRPDQGLLLSGDSLLLEAQLRDGSGRILTDRPVSWSSDDASIASVRSNGLVKGHAPGVTRIRAAAGGATGMATITVAEAARIVLSETTVRFDVRPGAAPPASQEVKIENGGGGTLSNLSYAVSHPSGQPSGWLQVSLNGSTAPSSLAFGVSTSGLSPGSYRADVRVSSPMASNSPETVRVELEVGGSGPRIRLSPSAVAFAVEGGGSSPRAQAVRVTNSGDGKLDDLTATVSYEGGSSGWVEISFERSQAPADLVVGVNPKGLNAGTYEARVAVRSPKAGNSPEHLSVRLTVGQAPARIRLDPGSVTFTATRGGSAPSSRTVKVENAGSGTLGGLSTAIAYGSGAGGWLKAELTSSQAPAEIALSVTRTDLSPGSYHAVLRVQSSAAANSPETVAVRLNVAPGVSLSRSTVRANPEEIVADGTSTSTITVRLRDAEGSAVTSGGHEVRLTLNGDGKLGSVKDEGGGRYTAVLTAPGKAGEATVRARVDGESIEERATVTFTKVKGNDDDKGKDKDKGKDEDKGNDKDKDKGKDNDKDKGKDNDKDEGKDKDDSAGTGTAAVKVSYNTVGGPKGDRHLRVTVSVRDGSGKPVRDALVAATIRNRSGGLWVRTGRTNAKGEVTFNVNNHPSGCYATTVTSVSAGKLGWNGKTPGNEYCKK